MPSTSSSSIALSAGISGQATTPVRQALDTKSLKAWMIQQSSLMQFLGGGEASKAAFSLEIRQFGFGQSNPTYKLMIRSNTATNLKSLVLRKKPDVVAHASAHALHREYRVLQALEQHNQQQRSESKRVPIPKVYAYCRDISVLGAEFYVMQFCQGRIYTDPSLPGLTPKERKAAYQEVLRVLSNLHSVNFRDVGLSSFGKHSRYVERNIQRLLMVSQKQQSQLSAARQSSLPELDTIAQQLSHAAPKCPDYCSLIHGDFKIDNLIFSESEPTKIICILDWELSTIGDALCDMANLSMMYFLPQELPAMAIAGIKGLNLRELGIPDRFQLLREYAKRNSVVDYELSKSWSGFYLAFLFFKNAVIVQGVAQRAKAGVASSAMAHKVAALLPTILEQTQEILARFPPPVTTMPAQQISKL